MNKRAITAADHKACFQYVYRGEQNGSNELGEGRISFRIYSVFKNCISYFPFSLYTFIQCFYSVVRL